MEWRQSGEIVNSFNCSDLLLWSVYKSGSGCVILHLKSPVGSSFGFVSWSGLASELLFMLRHFQHWIVWVDEAEFFSDWEKTLISICQARPSKKGWVWSCFDGRSKSPFNMTPTSFHWDLPENPQNYVLPPRLRTMSNSSNPEDLDLADTQEHEQNGRKIKTKSWVIGAITIREFISLYF